MKLLIVLHHRFELWTAPPWLAGRLRSDFPGLEVVHLPGYEGMEGELRDAEILIAWSLRPAQFAAATRLRWIHSPAAAVHLLMFPELVNSDVVITNARDVQGPVVAEHVMAQMLALAKRIPDAVRLQQRSTWGQQALWDMRPRPRELAGSRLVLVGAGSIGREVARRAAAMGMKVTIVREHPGKGNVEGAEKIVGPDGLDDALAGADFVVLAAPLTPATQNLIDAGRLARMGPDAFLVNVSRGPLVNEVELAEALRKRAIAGAALDVFTREPLAAESPFWQLDNVLVTPHSAALTESLWERHYSLISANLQRYREGEPLLAVVDKQIGY